MLGELKETSGVMQMKNAAHRKLTTLSFLHAHQPRAVKLRGPAARQNAHARSPLEPETDVPMVSNAAHHTTRFHKVIRRQVTATYLLRQSSGRLRTRYADAI